MSGDRYKINDQHATYFCTCTVINWIDLFTRKEFRDIIVESLNYCIRNKGLHVYSWVIMSNHIHLVASVDIPHTFSEFLRDFKKFSSKALIKPIQEINESRKDWLLDKFSFEAKRTRRATNYKIWKDSNHAIEIAGNIDVWQKIGYIHENPVKAGWVDEIDHYRYSSAKDYSGIKGLVNVEVL